MKKSKKLILMIIEIKRSNRKSNAYPREKSDLYSSRSAEKSGQTPVREKGGLNPDNLTEKALVNVEEDYQVCVRMLARAGGVGAENKPKRGRNPHC